MEKPECVAKLMNSDPAYTLFIGIPNIGECVTPDIGSTADINHRWARPSIMLVICPTNRIGKSITSKSTPIVHDDKNNMFVWHVYWQKSRTDSPAGKMNICEP
jgi:hypothetical protein